VNTLVSLSFDPDDSQAKDSLFYNLTVGIILTGIGIEVLLCVGYFAGWTFKGTAVFFGILELVFLLGAVVEERRKARAEKALAAKHE
jgi:hypothetical protein